MARIYYRKLKSRGVYANVAAFRRTIVEGTIQEVVPMTTKALKARTTGWAYTPDFQYKVDVEPTGIFTHVFPSGWGEQYWTWVSLGVKGHPIYPRRKYSKGFTPRSRKSGKYPAALSIYSYTPFTTPGGGYGGAGQRYFVGYRRFVPWWPGIRPRNFEQHVAKELRPEYLRLMRNMVRRAVRAARREAKDRP